MDRRESLRKTYDNIEQSLTTSRDRFSEEMQRLAMEINRLGGQVTYRERELIGTPSPSSSQPTFSLSDSTRHVDDSRRFLPESSGSTRNQESTDNYLPMVEDRSNGRYLNLCLDMKAYLPEDISVTSKGNFIQVHARHEDKHTNRLNEYKWEYILPEDNYPERIDYAIAQNGYLTINGTLAKPLPSGRENATSISRL
ncbi:uncharacterized protein [Centruroides vittatus]|uniref:uncharacterized protein n=1 Tax=Centruroides vittatus TaxID=120091 RepID=UPI003510477D